MSLVIQEIHKSNVKLLKAQSTQVLEDFCKLSWDFVENGSNNKLYQSAAQKLDVNIWEVEEAVKALVFLFIEATKYQLSEEAFRESVIHLDLPEHFNEVLYKELVAHRNVLETALQGMSVQHPQFKDLQWRFQAQIYTQCLKSQIVPKVVLKLDLEKAGEVESFALESDIPNIVHMSEVLNQALQEAKSNHSRKMQRGLR